MELKIKKTHRNAVIPKRATEGSAGFDLSAALDEPIDIMPGETKNISSGIAIELPLKDMVALMFARSSLGAKYGVTLANSVGVIDSDFRGTIGMVLVNNSTNPFHIESGDRLAQLIVISTISLNVVEVEELNSTKREIGGFGSTGVKELE